MGELAWGERTLVMGIINVTSDSFSGDGLAIDGASAEQVTATARAQGEAFVAAGADLLDVGAESSRPAQFYGDHPRTHLTTELERAVPVVRALTGALGARALVSIDTTRGEVARAALLTGAGMVNDVWAGTQDPTTLVAAAEADAYLVLMHNKARAEYADGPFDEVVAWLRAAVGNALAAGVRRERLVLDPGIGFGKTAAHSLELLHRLAELKTALGNLPLLVGTSRKRFLGELTGGAATDDRLEGTLASLALAIAGGADIVRVHDVAAAVRAVRVSDGIVRWRS